MASQEYYTPPREINLSDECLGGIDLDPCANPQKTVPARIHYVGSEGWDGLSLPWGEKLYRPGSTTEYRWAKPFTVLVNAPWNDLETWTDKMLSEYASGHFTAGIFLVPVRVERPWFQRLQDFPVWFPNERINYVQPQPDGTLKQTKGIAHASCAFYLGDNEQRFREVFGRHGRIYRALPMTEGRLVSVR